MTKYPCADTRCMNDVNKPGEYCPACAKRQKEAAKREQEMDRKQYVSKNEGLRK